MAITSRQITDDRLHWWRSRKMRHPICNDQSSINSWGNSPARLSCLDTEWSLLFLCIHAICRGKTQVKRTPRHPASDFQYEDADPICFRRYFYVRLLALGSVWTTHHRSFGNSSHYQVRTLLVEYIYRFLLMKFRYVISLQSLAKIPFVRRVTNQISNRSADSAPWRQPSCFLHMSVCRSSQLIAQLLPTWLEERRYYSCVLSPLSSIL